MCNAGCRSASQLLRPRPNWERPAGRTARSPGKPKKLALTACMRKLLTILNAQDEDVQELASTA
jgi:transposase